MTKAKAKAKAKPKAAAAAVAGVDAPGDAGPGAAQPAPGVAAPPALAPPPPPLAAPPALVPPALVAPPPPAAVPLGAGPLDEHREAERQLALRNPQSIPFGRHFTLARVYRTFEFKAWSCRCFVHEGCNKTLTMSSEIDAPEAKRRIMECCLRGLRLADARGVRKKNIHMDEEPKLYAADDVRSEALLQRLAETV